VLQDDSNRFDRVSNYEGSLTRPWSASPRTAHITLALGGLANEEVNYTIRLSDGLRVYEWPGEGQRRLNGSFNGRPAITVRKLTSRPEEFRMRMSGIAANPVDPAELRCFLDLWIRVGEGDRGQEGFAEIEVEGWGPPAPPVTPPGDSHPGRPRPSPGGDHRPPGTEEP
jgi:hypothetical protein